jgi:hypothetical protein
MSPAPVSSAFDVEELLVQARQRVAEMHIQRITEASRYGANDRDGVGGIGSTFLLLDEPEVYGLPPDPRVLTADLCRCSSGPASPPRACSPLSRLPPGACGRGGGAHGPGAAPGCRIPRSWPVHTLRSLVAGWSAMTQLADTEPSIAITLSIWRPCCRARRPSARRLSPGPVARGADRRVPAGRPAHRAQARPAHVAVRGHPEHDGYTDRSTHELLRAAVAAVQDRYATWAIGNLAAVIADEQTRTPAVTDAPQRRSAPGVRPAAQDQRHQRPLPVRVAQLRRDRADVADRGHDDAVPARVAQHRGGQVFPSGRGARHRRSRTGNTPQRKKHRRRDRTTAPILIRSRVPAPAGMITFFDLSWLAQYLGGLDDPGEEIVLQYVVDRFTVAGMRPRSATS